MKDPFEFSPNPVHSYAAALERIEKLRAQEPVGMNPVGRLQFMTHGQTMEKAIVFGHGYTNCPQQFNLLGQRFHALGYNVLCAPLPHHGLADRLTSDIANLTLEEMVRHTHECLDIAQGLGKKVAIAGISASGVMAAYAAHNRTDIYSATLLAPAFGLGFVPARLTGALTRLLSLLPNQFVWWDPKNKDVGGIAHAYPRFSTHSLAQTLQLSQSVRSIAQKQAPLVTRLLVVTTETDLAISNKMYQELVADWRRHGAQVITYEFPSSLGLEHDFIEPTNPKANVEAVYPKLIELIDGL